MKRFGKILLIVVGVVVLIAAVALVALSLLFDPNDYKSQIDAAIEKQIGRKVDISGDIGLSVFPWLGIELGHVEVANAKGFGDKPMAEMQSAQISVKLLPLLSRDIEVGTVSLDGLRLRLAKNAQGRSNWADISEHLAAGQDSEPGDVPSTDSQTPPPNAETDSGFKLSSLQIGAIDIQNAGAVWQDAQTGADYRVSDLKVETGRLSDGEPVRLEISADIAAPAKKVKAKLNLATHIEPDIAEQFYRFTDMSVNVLASGAGVPAKRQQATLSGSGELDMADGRVKLTGVTLQGAGLNITGNLDGMGLNDTPSYTGRITLKDFDPRAVMRELAIDAPATQSDDALSSAGFDAQFSATGNKIELKQIVATLDDSSLKGSARVNNFARPDIGFDLGLDEIDVDDYLPPGSAEQAKTDKPPTSGGGQKDAEIDLSALKKLRMDGQLAVGALTAANIQVSNAKLAVKARNGVLTIEPLTADLYQGKLRVTARVDASRDTPTYALKGNLNGLQFQPLLKDVADTDKVGALAALNIDIRTAGKQVAEMKRALNGQFGFDLRDGAFFGFNLAKVIGAARGRLAGNSAATSGVGTDEKTPFNRFAAQFNARDGVLSGKDLNLTSSQINASGAGSYDLAANKLDYTLDAQVPDKASGKLADLAGVAVPIKLSGDLMSPSYSLDVAGALKGVAQQRLQAEKSKLQEKARDKLKERAKKIDPKAEDRIRKGIKGLFGGDKK